MKKLSKEEKLIAEKLSRKRKKSLHNTKKAKTITYQQKYDMTDPRKKHYRERVKIKKRFASLNYPCALCGRPIDYSLHYLHPGACELDEIIPVSKGGSAVELSNLQPVHRKCNQLKSNRSIKTFADLKNKPKIKDYHIKKIETSNKWND